MGPGPIRPEQMATMGSERIARSVKARAAARGSGALKLLEVVALLGDAADPRALTRLSGVEPDRIPMLLDGFAAAAVLEGPPDWRFAHPLLRASVYEEIPAARRAAAHARAASLLAELDSEAEAVAAHILLSPVGAIDDAIGMLERAADRASERGAAEGVVTYLKRALREEIGSADKRGAMLARLGRAQTALRDPAAIVSLQEAIGLIEDPDAALEAHLALAELLALAGQWEAMIATAQSGLSRFAGRNTRAMLDLEATAAAYRSYDVALVARFDDDLPQLMKSVAGRSDVDSACLRWVLACIGASRDLPANEIVDLVAPQSLRWSMERFGRESVLTTQGVFALIHAERFDLALKAAREIREDGRRRGSVLGVIGGMGLEAVANDRQGNLRSSEADFRLQFEMLGESALGMMPIVSTVNLAINAILERAGLSDVADLTETFEMPPAGSGTLTGAFLSEARGAIRMSRGDLAGALVDLRAAEAIYRPLQVGPRVSSWRSRLALALPPEEVEEARALAAEELELARVVGGRRGEGTALRTLGMLRDGAAGVELLERSAAALAEPAVKLELARTLTELGSALAADGQREAGRAHLRDALVLAQQCGAEKLEERTIRELRAAGGKPRRRSHSGPDSLTPAERRVAEAAAAGLTNREIAQTLFVSLRTVELHLTNSFRKLAITSRQELAKSLGGAG